MRVNLRFPLAEFLRGVLDDDGPIAASLTTDGTTVANIGNLPGHMMGLPAVSMNGAAVSAPGAGLYPGCTIESRSPGGVLVRRIKGSRRFPALAVNACYAVYMSAVPPNGYASTGGIALARNIGGRQLPGAEQLSNGDGALVARIQGSTQNVTIGSSQTTIEDDTWTDIGMYIPPNETAYFWSGAANLNLSWWFELEHLPYNAAR